MKNLSFLSPLVTSDFISDIVYFLYYRTSIAVSFIDTFNFIFNFIFIDIIFVVVGGGTCIWLIFQSPPPLLMFQSSFSLYSVTTGSRRELTPPSRVDRSTRPWHIYYVPRLINILSIIIIVDGLPPSLFPQRMHLLHAALHCDFGVFHNS